MRILILDDDDSRHTQFKRNFIGYLLTCVHTSQEAIDHLQNNEYDAVFLDHDLGGKVYVDSFGDESTGYTVAKWLSENPSRKPRAIYIHSFNPVGAARMQSILPDSILAPGLWTVNNTTRVE